MGKAEREVDQGLGCGAGRAPPAGSKPISAWNRCCPSSSSGCASSGVEKENRSEGARVSGSWRRRQRCRQRLVIGEEPVDAGHLEQTANEAAAVRQRQLPALPGETSAGPQETAYAAAVDIGDPGQIDHSPRGRRCSASAKTWSRIERLEISTSPWGETTSTSASAFRSCRISRMLIALTHSGTAGTAHKLTDPDFRYPGGSIPEHPTCG